MKTLTLHSIEMIDHLEQPDEVTELSMDSPALSIFTDFRHYKPFVISPNTPAVDAEALMIAAHVKLKIVVDKFDNFIGVVSSHNLNEENIIRLVAAGTSRHEVVVKDLMVSKDDLKAFSYQEIEKVTVQDILNALQKNGLQHCLVVDTETHLIRGIISASDIARKLHIPLTLYKAPTFADVFSAVSASHESRKYAV